MKRFVFWFVAALAAVALLRSSHSQHRGFDRAEHRMVVIHDRPDRHGSTTRQVVRIERDGNVITINDTTDRDRDRDPARDPERQVQDLVVVDGLPVPIEPGTRVTEARPEPPVPPKPPAPPRAPRPPKAPRVRMMTTPPAAAVPTTPPVEVTGRLSANEDRARKDARSTLVRRVTEWVRPEVPDGWRVPDSLVDRLIREVRVVPQERGRDVGTMYVATMNVDLSPEARDRIVNAYRHEQTHKKLYVLGGGLAGLLVVLATVSGYIRADEATKGYYTNRLRVAAAAGLGAATVLAYQWLT